MEPGEEKPAYYIPVQTREDGGFQPDQEANRSTLCGYGKWRPKCLQRFANGKGFVFFACLLTLLQSMLGSGYTSSVVTTIERRFQLKSSESGIVVSSYEIGALLVIAFVSYFGGRGHRPKWIGYGSIIMSFGTVLFVLPHFVGSRYDIASEFVNKTDPDVCTTTESNGKKAMSCDERTSYTVYILFFIGAQVLLGVGTSPVFTLGTTYVDDNIPRKHSAMYMAILYCMGAIGPAFGFVVGAMSLRIYVDIGFIDLDEIPIEPEDPRWVGAWWGGYLIIGLFIFLISLPILGYPKTLESAATKEEEDAKNENQNEGDNHIPMQFTSGKLRHFPRAVYSLFTNPIYVCTTMSGAMELAIVTGFVTFIPKFIESQFSLPPSTASLLTGVLVPGAACGTVFGGFLVKKFNMNTTGTARLAFICVLVSFISFASLFPLRCGALDLAGISVGYKPREFKEIEIGTINITSQCNSRCQCDPWSYQPVCGENGITYYSPCHAGCQQIIVGVDRQDNLVMNFTNCACISEYFQDEVTRDDSTYATFGKCERDCSKELGLFMAVLTGLVVITATVQVPILMTTLRCVGENEKPLALGMQFVLLKTIALIPAPMYYGKAIDGTCLLWEKLCEDEGACLEYDLNRFRFVYIGLSSGLKFLSLIFQFLCYMACRRRYCKYETRTAEAASRNDNRNTNPSTISGNVTTAVTVPCLSRLEVEGVSFETSL
ncbi:solute carrier organic anion transporter family member 5A1-like [Glandiceps talaboti]